MGNEIQKPKRIQCSYIGCDSMIPRGKEYCSKHRRDCRGFNCEDCKGRVQDYGEYCDKCSKKVKQRDKENKEKTKREEAKAKLDLEKALDKLNIGKKEPKYPLTKYKLVENPKYINFEHCIYGCKEIELVLTKNVNVYMYVNEEIEHIYDDIMKLEEKRKEYEKKIFPDIPKYKPHIKIKLKTGYKDWDFRCGGVSNTAYIKDTINIDYFNMVEMVKIIKELRDANKLDELREFLNLY